MEATQYFFILLSIVVVVNSLPTAICQNKTLYDAIIEKCPIVKEVNLFAKQDILNDCKDWCKIQNTSLSRNTEDDYLCLVYYKSFTSFCTNMVENGVTLNDTLIPKSTNYTDDLCKLNSSLNIQIFNDNKKCTKLCYNYDGNPIRLCSLAYYYTSFTYKKSDKLSTVEVNTDSTDTDHVKNKKLDTVTQNNDKSHSPIMIDNKIVTPSSEKSIVGNISEKNNISTSNARITSKIPTDIKNNLDQTPDNTINGKASEDTDVEKPPKKSDIEQLNTSSALPVVQHQEQTNSRDELVESADEGRDTQQDNDVGPPLEDDDDDQVIKNYDDSKIMVSSNQPKKQKPETVEGEPANFNNTEDLDGESYFFFYFMVVCVLFVLGYVGYHNRQKVLALVLEGKRGKREYRRRPNSANYHKLDSNLEEALSSSCSKNSSHVIY